MDKRYMHHVWTKVRWIKPWYFLVLAVISGAVCVFALRANNQHMVELRDAVHAADKSGGDVQKPLHALQSYVTSHMNTSLSTSTSVYPPVQLKFTYDQLVKEQAKKFERANAGLYSRAQAHCEALNSVDFSGHNRVPCIEQYVKSHGNEVKPAPAIPEDLYKFSFASPTWSPDLAGWSMAAAVLGGLLFIFTLIVRRWFRLRSR